MNYIHKYLYGMMEKSNAFNEEQLKYVNVYIYVLNNALSIK